MSWVFACVIGGDTPLIVTYAFVMWVCLSFPGLDWADESQENQLTTWYHPTGSCGRARKTPTESELAYFFVQEACVGYLLCARFFQAS